MRHNTFKVNHVWRAAKKLEPYCLPVCLFVQAALLFARLDLLPVWGDEQFTLDTSVQPLSQIAGVVRGDIHPPLYYFLVHFWLHAPWVAPLIVKARAFSGLWALASTVLLRKLWFVETRTLLLWTLSPCLILYGRMGRSYTLQLFLACLALYWGMALIRDPRRRGAMLLYSGAGVLLLYTHYLPALAILLAVAAFLLYRRAWIAFAAPLAIMAVAYIPWLLDMRSAFGRVLHSDPYLVSQHRIFDQTIRLLYLPVSFTFGESIPLWVAVAGAVLAPALVLILYRTLKNPPDWLPLVLLSAVIAYIGAGRWVSFAFVPARLLFVLPFYLMLLSKRAWICAALACLWIGCLFSYFRQQDFLNKGYLLPFDRMAYVIERSRQAGGPVPQLIVDAPGLDVSPLTHRLPALAGEHPDSKIIWMLRGARGHRPPPAGAREVWRAEFVPYSRLDRYIMKLLDWETQPTHVLELTEYSLD
jgi:hypothetical protein